MFDNSLAIIADTAYQAGMDDVTKYALAALLILIGSHLLLWAWLKRKIASVQRDMEREKADPNGDPVDESSQERNS